MSLSLPVCLGDGRAPGGARSGASSPRSCRKGLYARSALIVIAPMVILQSVLTYVFMERHWQRITTRLSTVLTQDIAALDRSPSAPTAGQTNDALLTRIAQERLKIDIEFLPQGRTAAGAAKTILLDRRRGSVERDQASDRQALLARHGRALDLHRDPHCSSTIRSCASSPIAAPPMRRTPIYFMLWMVGTSFVLIVVAIVFLAQSDQADPSRSPTRRRPSARAAILNSGRAARARCARPATPSSK